MPLAAIALLHAALGLGLATLAARELRASPRAVTSLAAFAALGLHELLVGAPAAFYLLARHTDWMVSYVVTGARIPSALALVAGVGCGALGLAGFALGARQVRDHRPRHALAAAAALAAIALVGLAAARGRVGVVGTTAQFRGGFGVVPFWSSRASTAVLLVLLVQGGALAHLAWTLTRARPDAPPRPR